MIWAGVLVVGLGCYAFKLGGLSVPQRLLDRPLVQRVAALIPIALLAALIAVQVLADGQRVTLDARLAALAAAAVMLALRLPFLVVVFGAAAVAALLRLVGWMP